MAARQTKPDRLNAFSDGMFAVIITVLTLDLKPPHAASLTALLSLWPTGLSYSISYLFIAIIWVNHHHLMMYADIATTRLIWGKCAAQIGQECRTASFVLFRNGKHLGIEERITARRSPVG